MKAMDLLSPNPTIKAALDALASLTAERRQRDLHLASMVSAEMHDTAKAIATRHAVSADAVLADLLDAPSGFMSNMHTPEGLAGLGAFYAETLDANTPASVVTVRLLTTWNPKSDTRSGGKE